MSRWLTLIPLVVLLGLSALFLFRSLGQDPHQHPHALVGQPVPKSPVSPIEGGEEVALASAVQGPALLNVFASWCVPCRVEHGQLLALKAKGVRIVGLSWRDDPGATRALLQELGNPYARVLSDPADHAGIDLGLSGVPETYVVDGRGMIVDKISAPLGPEDVTRLEAELARLSSRH